MPTNTTGFPDSEGVPELLGSRYEVEVEIGSGAFATTFRGRDRRLDRAVAIKILSREFSQDSLYVQRFEREAQTAASISNANVVDVYDFGQEGDVLYIVMQYVAGEDLKHLIVREGNLAPSRAREITLQILNGLVPIHQAGIIHRDIKPQNILIGTDNRARVADFGIAQMDVDAGLTTAGTTVGTAAYMAPEQAEGGRTTAATDLYAVGVVLFEMLTGVLPFNAPTTMSLMLAHIQQRPVAPSERANGRPIPADLDAIVLQAMAKSPQDRFRSAAAMSQALRAGSGMMESPAVPSARLEPTVRVPSRNPASISNAPPRVPPPSPPKGADDGEGSGLNAVLGGFLVLLVVAVIAGAAYLWWDGRNGMVAPRDEPLPTSTAQVIAPTEESTATIPLQQIAPVATNTPSPTAAPAPTSTPTDTPIPVSTEVPPTAEPTIDSGPTIGPDQGGEVPSIQPVDPVTGDSQPQVIEPLPSPTLTNVITSPQQTLASHEEKKPKMDKPEKAPEKKPKTDKPEKAPKMMSGLHF